MAKSRPEHEFFDAEEWESWGALMMLRRSVLQSLDAELRRAHDLAVTEFDVLITLFNAPGQRLGMSALADRVLLSPAGTTHLVNRLERDRLVRREFEPTDRRMVHRPRRRRRPRIASCATAPITTYCDGRRHIPPATAPPLASPVGTAKRFPFRRTTGGSRPDTKPPVSDDHLASRFDERDADGHGVRPAFVRATNPE